MHKTIAGEALPTERQEDVPLLAVGSPEEWERRSGHLPRPGNIAYVAFNDVTPALLEQLRPDTIVSPALAQDFDCIDLAMLLHALEYRGIYRATAFELPRPQLVETEIIQLCPGLDFEIITGL